MKKYLIICYLLIAAYLLPGPLFAQEESYLFHYPLNVGDYWEYILFPVYEFTRSVVGDTLMPNGKHYRIVEQVESGYKSHTFQCVSKDGNLYYYSEQLLFKLNLKINDTWRNDYESTTYKVTEIGDTTLWAKKYKYAMIEPDNIFSHGFFIVDSIGIFSETGEMWEIDLQGAIINGKQYGTITSVQDIEKNDPVLSFSGNYPNPFNGTTTISFNVAKYQHVNITVYDILGKRVRTLINSYRDTGSHKIIWDGRDQYGSATASGLYFVRISTPEKSQVIKVSYLK